MKLNNNYFYTLKENSKEEESISGNLLVRAGMIKKIGSGIYLFLPLGLKIINKIKKIVKEEIDKTGAQELLMPSLIPLEYYESSGRVASFGNDMFSLKDRYSKQYVLGPTHEELFTIAAKNMVRSYKDLPFTLYQYAEKFRDEIRPRYGLIRLREFMMKDAYSFDKNEEGLDISYNKMKDAYNNIFKRLNIDYKIVKASTGVMGGSLSEEYQALTDIGEDEVILCSKCNYASNIEVSECISSFSNDDPKLKKELVSTPNKETIEDVCKYLNINKRNILKALLMNVDNKLVVCFIKGDRELNQNKLLRLLNAKEINFADDNLINSSNAVFGYTGPINLNAKIVIDNEVLKMRNFCCGANKLNYHYINVNIEDFKYDLVGDIVDVQKDDLCPLCGNKLIIKKGIEVGNLFKLGTKYSESLNLTYLDEFNKSQFVTMGCYGLGVQRVLTSIIEQNHDDEGMILPLNIAPFEVSIVLIDVKDKLQIEKANELYDKLQNIGIDILLDNRDIRPGIKFKDMDLIGIPLRITIGKKINDNIVEVKERIKTEYQEISYNKIIEYIKEYKNKNIK